MKIFSDYDDVEEGVTLVHEKLLHMINIVSSKCFTDSGIQAELPVSLLRRSWEFLVSMKLKMKLTTLSIHCLDRKRCAAVVCGTLIRIWSKWSTCPKLRDLRANSASRRYSNAVRIDASVFVTTSLYF